MKKKRWAVLAAAGFFLGLTIYMLTRWYTERYDTSFAGLLFTLMTPMKGVGSGFWKDFLGDVLPPVLWGTAGYLLLTVLLRSRRIGLMLKTRAPAAEKVRAGAAAGLAVLGLICLIAAPLYAWSTLHVGEYVRNLREQTAIYEEKYQDPALVKLTAPDKKKNVIWLVLESMETTYASSEDGGVQPENYMPRLTALARENISFSNTDRLGGIHSTNNTNWTMAALFAGSSGLPFAFPVEQNSMNKYDRFAPEVTALGDILEGDGYTQEFLCGSDAAYGGRALYFQSHGEYGMYDLFTARKNGDIPEDYYVWWGFEDRVLFRIARQELTRLYEEGQPFNLTMLTVDAHHLGGYTCEECGSEFADRTANVIACTDRQVGAFVDWCREQPFWENTVMIITGDHPRMDTCLTEGISFQDRTIYNCFLNADKQPEGGTQFRESVMMDLFPTMLSAMGYTIEGDRLGLGTDLFSGRPTLAEEMGYEALNREVQKYSAYFVEHFAR